MIRIIRGELAAAEAEAVLLPVTGEWGAVTPAMRRLEMAAGEAPARQCRQLGELPVGSAVITGAGDLTAQFMIHIVVRSVDERVTASGVRRGLQNAIRRLEEWGIQRVAVAPLGTGAGNLDADESAALMVPALAERVRAGGPPTEVEIYVETDYEHDVFIRHLEAEQS